MLPATVREGFICLLMESGNVSGSARTLGINRMTAYGWRDDPEFARRWDIALDIARSNPMQLADGVAQALVTTAAGLLVAIPAMVAYAYFRGRAASLLANLEIEAMELLTLLQNRNK